MKATFWKHHYQGCDNGSPSEQRCRSQWMSVHTYVRVTRMKHPNILLKIVMTVPSATSV